MPSCACGVIVPFPSDSGLAVVSQVRARLCFYVSLVAQCFAAVVYVLPRCGALSFELAAVSCRALVGDICVIEAVCCFRRVVTCGTVTV
jgi:hypothetical protein